MGNPNDVVDVTIQIRIPADHPLFTEGGTEQAVVTFGSWQFTTDWQHPLRPAGELLYLADYRDDHGQG